MAGPPQSKVFSPELTGVLTEQAQGQLKLHVGLRENGGRGALQDRVPR
ncbi:MAG: hypothetical protein ACI8QS_000724 [Planctomycetota bacterium]|jgi:hypothetical protein